MLRIPKPTLSTINYRQACNDLAREFCKTLGLDYSYTWWVADNEGDLFWFCDGEMFAYPTDMVTAIEYDINLYDWCGFYDQWIESNNKNLKSWIKTLK